MRAQILTLLLVIAMACLPAAAASPTPPLHRSTTQPTRTVVYPVETAAVLLNPHMGWALIDHALPGHIDAGRTVPLCGDCTAYRWFGNVQVLSTWAAVERQPGVYDWSLMDRAVEYWAGQGKAIHLRFSTEDFGQHPDFAGCPRWLFELGVPSIARGAERYPDYTHPLYRQHLKSFLAELARHFADDPRVETVDLRGYGEWGEWHSGYNYDTVEQRVAALRGIIDAWRQAVRGRKLLCLSASYEWRLAGRDPDVILPKGTSINEQPPPSYGDFVHRSAFDYACRLPDVTLRRDGVAGAVWWQYDGRLLDAFARQSRQPLFMEFFGDVRHHGEWLPQSVAEALTCHATWCNAPGWLGGGAGSATDFYNNHADLVRWGLRRLGYRFWPVRAAWPARVAAGQALVLETTWENRGAGRCYRRYPLAVCLLRGGALAWQGVDRAFDQTYMAAGETYDWTSRLRLPRSLPAGTYRLAVAMVDGQGKPALSLPLAGGRGKWYPLGEIAVEGRGAPHPAPLPQGEGGNAAGGRASAPLRLRREGAGYLSPALAAGTYRVSFRYRVARDPERLLTDGDDGGYYVLGVRGPDGSVAEHARWYDRAGDGEASKTFIVTVPTGGRLAWQAVGGGELKVSGATCRRLEPDTVWRAAVGDGLAGAWQGRRDYAAATPQGDWFPFLSTEPGRLQADTTYTVTFSCTAEPGMGRGSYFYLRLRGEGEPFYLWVQRHGRHPVRHTVSFRTGKGEPVLEWGIHNGGGCEVGDVAVVRSGGEWR